VDEFVTIDFETAVFSPNSAISVGLVKYRGTEAVDTFYSLIRPPRLYVRPQFTEIHGLTAEDVRDAPRFRQVWKDGMEEFIAGLPLAAHNAKFDMNVLCAALTHYGLPLPPLEFFCSLRLSRRVWPHLASHALTALGREFGIEYEAHNALADAQTCGKIISLCVAEVSQRSGGELGIAEVLSQTGIEMKRLDTAASPRKEWQGPW